MAMASGRCAAGHDGLAECGRRRNGYGPRNVGLGGGGVAEAEPGASAWSRANREADADACGHLGDSGGAPGRRWSPPGRPTHSRPMATATVLDDRVRDQLHQEREGQDPFVGPSPVTLKERFEVLLISGPAPDAQHRFRQRHPCHTLWEVTFHGRLLAQMTRGPPIPAPARSISAERRCLQQWSPDPTQLSYTGESP